MKLSSTRRNIDIIIMCYGNSQMKLAQSTRQNCQLLDETLILLLCAMGHNQKVDSHKYIR